MIFRVVKRTDWRTMGDLNIMERLDDEMIDGILCRKCEGNFDFIDMHWWSQVTVMEVRF